MNQKDAQKMAFHLFHQWMNVLGWEPAGNGERFRVPTAAAIDAFLKGHPEQAEHRGAISDRSHGDGYEVDAVKWRLNTECSERDTEAQQLRAMFR